MASAAKAQATPKARRAKGTGAIYETPEGNFRAVVKLKDSSGKLVPYTHRLPTKAAADAWLSDIIARHRGGTLSPKQKDDTNTVRKLMSVWIDDKYQAANSVGKPTVATVADYEAQIKMWILPTLGQMELSRLHRDNIYDWLKMLNRAVSPKTKKLLSHDRKHRVWGVLRQAMAYGVTEGYLAKNPLKGIEGLKQQESAVLNRVMTEADYQKFMAYINKKGCDHAKGYCALRWKLGVQGTRRQMEVLGLDWRHVHLNAEKPYMRINQRLRRQGWYHDCGGMITGDDGKVAFPCGQKTAKKCSKAIPGGLMVVEGTKPGDSVRPEIPIKEFLNAFIIHKQAQQIEHAEAVKNGTYDPLVKEHKTLVFTQPKTGRAYQARMDSKTFERLQTEAGLENRYRLHDLRHTGISRLVDATGNIRVVQDIAGHRTLAVTGKYAKPSMESREDAFAKTSAMDRRKGKALKARETAS